MAGSSPVDALAAGADANGTTPTPALAADPALVFTAAAVVDGGACGLLTNGSVACVCGYADAAQEQALPAEPRLLFNGTGGFTALAARGGTVCSVGAEGSLVCSGALERGSREALPQRAGTGCREGPASAGAAAAGSAFHHAPALTIPLPCTPCLPAGVTGGYLTPEGYPELSFSAAPAVIDASRKYTTVSVGGSGLAFHACGLTADGEALCW